MVTDDVKDAERLIDQYPWLEEIYGEMFAYRRKPEEVLTMFSESLSILDKNTTQYMIEEQQKMIEEERRAKEEERRAKEEERKAKEEERRAKEEERRAKIEAQQYQKKLVVSTSQILGGTREKTMELLMDQCKLSAEEAIMEVDKYWMK